MKEEKALSFNVEGEFITQLAKEWLFYEGKEFKKVMELLLSCMCGTDMSEKNIETVCGRCSYWTSCFFWKHSR